MTYLEMKKQLNTMLNGELVPWKRLIQHINYAIDEINTVMNTVFPIVDPEGSAADMNTDYDAIPNKYIRTVILPGAVHHYFMVDDEGTSPEIDFARQFEAGKFFMLRDYSSSVPDVYKVKDNADGSFAGAVESNYEDYVGLRGIERDTRLGVNPLDPLSWVGEVW